MNLLPPCLPSSGGFTNLPMKNLTLAMGTTPLSLSQKLVPCGLLWSFQTLSYVYRLACFCSPLSPLSEFKSKTFKKPIFLNSVVFIIQVLPAQNGQLSVVSLLISQKRGRGSGEVDKDGPHTYFFSIAALQTSPERLHAVKALPTPFPYFAD